MARVLKLWERGEKYKMEVKYSGNSQRPTIFKVEYEINGERNIRRILNK